jgi:hypothetical protein
MAVIRKQCPLPVTRDCLLKQLLQQPQVPIAGLDVLAEVWTELPAHSTLEEKPHFLLGLAPFTPGAPRGRYM